MPKCQKIFKKKTKCQFLGTVFDKLKTNNELRIKRHTEMRKRNFTDDEIIEMAKQYSSIKDLTENDRSLQTILYRRGLIKQCTWLEKKVHYYTDEEILEVAHRYEYLKDFCDEYENLYQLASKRKLDLSFLKKAVTQWTDETALAEAAKYETISEFRKKGKGACAYLSNNGLLDKCNFKRVLNPFTDNLENIVYGYFFNEQNACYIGRTYEQVQRDWSHRSGKKWSSVYEFAKEHNVEIPQMTIIESGLTIDESVEKEDFYVKKYKAEGWNLINRAKTGKQSGSIGGLGKKYPKKRVFELARQFQYKSEFQKAYPLEYAAAQRRGWLKEMDFFDKKYVEDGFYDDKEKCFEMLNGKTKKECYINKELVPWYRSANRNGWEEEIFGNKKIEKKVENGYYDDIENIRKAAAEYSTRTEFLNGNSTAYHYALKHKIMDELFPLEKPRHKRDSLTKEACMELFAACGYSKSKLKREDCGVYNKMWKNGWFEKEQYMTVDEAMEIAKGCKSKKELSEKYHKAYICLLNAKRINEIVFPEGKKPRSYYTKDVCRNIALECGGRFALCKKNRYVYDICNENDWLDEFYPKAA